MKRLSFYKAGVEFKFLWKLPKDGPSGRVNISVVCWTLYAG